MLRRHLLLLPCILLLALLLPTARAAAAPPARVRLVWPAGPRSPFPDEGIICTSDMVWRNPRACPSYGPSTTAARVASIRLPDPLPALAIVPLGPAEGAIVPRSYAQVIQNYAPVYRHPIEASYGLPPIRNLGAGYVWVSVQGQTTYEGRGFYQINADEYVPAEALAFYGHSAFQGVALAAQPERPFAWILKGVQPSLTPAGELNAAAPVYSRYELVQIFAAENVGGEVWYLISPDQWINQIFVGKVTPSPVPAGVDPGAAWIDINLFEQTLAAYVGPQMVYATLVSSGLPRWETPPGLFQVWQKVQSGPMSGAFNRPDYYALEDVPWSLFFNQDIALHGAYWHNGFGYRHSHGCVNLAPRDARWLFEWASVGTWVLVQPGEDLPAN